MGQVRPIRHALPSTDFICQCARPLQWYVGFKQACRSNANLKTVRAFVTFPNDSALINQARASLINLRSAYLLALIPWL
eukprot:31094-Eustigmatos_ZCMA.PRE.1